MVETALRDCAGVEPGQPAPSGDERRPGSAACSGRGRGRTPCRWRTGGCSVGSSSGVTAGPRRRSARGELRLDSRPEPWHNNGDRLGLSELGAVTRVRLLPGPGPHPTSEFAPTLSEPAVACEHERRSAQARARGMSPPAASSARRAHSQSPAQTLTRQRSASSVAQRRARSSTATRSHVRQMERSTWQTGQVRRRRGRHTRPQSRQARRCFVRQSPRRFRPLPRTP